MNILTFIARVLILTFILIAKHYLSIAFLPTYYDI